jgi:hypothetical protein
VTRTQALALGRHIGAASLAGLVAGIVVGGLLGRVVMRISGFLAGPGLVGVDTANGNPVGTITLEGTIAIIVFVGVGAGLVGGMLYAVTEPWLRPLGRWRGLVFGGALLAAAGSTVIESGNTDFIRFGPPLLNVLMFAALFVLFGAAIAWLFDRVTTEMRRTGTVPRVVEGLAWLALVPAALAVVAAFSVVLEGDPLPMVLFVVPLLAAALVRWRSLPARLGYAALAVPVVLGFWRMASNLPLM